MCKLRHSHLEVDPTHEAREFGRLVKVDVFVPQSDILRLAKTEIQRSKWRRQISSAKISGFSIWDIALFLFVAMYEDSRVAVQQVSSEIGMSDVLTTRLLLLMEAEGMVLFQNGRAGTDLSVRISPKTQAAIIDYLTN